MSAVLNTTGGCVTHFLSLPKGVACVVGMSILGTNQISFPSKSNTSFLTTSILSSTLANSE